MNNAIEAVPEELARELEILPLRFKKDDLIVGIASQLDDEVVNEKVERLKSETSKSIKVHRVDEKLLRDTLVSAYADLNEIDPQKLKVSTAGEDGAVADLVNSILENSVRLRASDIHIEPNEKDLLVRVRIDGILEELVRLPSNLAAPLVSRLKVQAKMNIIERRRPQDGQFSTKVDGVDFDVRMATIATLFGEKAELRLLDTSRAVKDLTDLGMSAENFEQYRKLIGSSHGLIVAAGPTGSGKTTTLQSSMRVLNTPERNISTIEDPVEYVVPGINHIPVIDEIGVGFAEQLRALLRQDPDIIFVGESRDAETSKISMHAALAGRLVLTTLHSQDAVSVIYRLFQMDVEPHLLAASLRGIVAQRLLRRNCEFCTEEYEASKEEKLILGREDDEKLKLKRGEGCTLCRGSGFLDRIGVYQILTITDKIRDAISKRPDSTTLAKVASEEGMKSLPESAFELVLQGLTTVSEVTKVITTDV